MTKQLFFLALLWLQLITISCLGTKELSTSENHKEVGNNRSQDTISNISSKKSASPTQPLGKIYRTKLNAELNARANLNQQIVEGEEIPRLPEKTFLDCEDFLNNLDIISEPIAPNSNGFLKATLLQGSTYGYSINWYTIFDDHVASDWSFNPTKGGLYCYVIESDCTKTGVPCRLNDCPRVPCSGFPEIDPEFSKAIHFQTLDGFEKGDTYVITTVDFADFNDREATIHWFDNSGNIVETGEHYNRIINNGRYCARVFWGCYTGESCLSVGCDEREKEKALSHKIVINQDMESGGQSNVEVRFNSAESPFGPNNVKWYDQAGAIFSEGQSVYGLNPGKYRYQIMGSVCYNEFYDLEVTGCETINAITSKDYTIEHTKSSENQKGYVNLVFSDYSLGDLIIVKWVDNSGNLVGNGPFIEIDSDGVLCPVFSFNNCIKKAPCISIKK